MGSSFSTDVREYSDPFYYPASFNPINYEVQPRSFKRDIAEAEKLKDEIDREEFEKLVLAKDIEVAKKLQHKIHLQRAQREFEERALARELDAIATRDSRLALEEQERQIKQAELARASYYHPYDYSYDDQAELNEAVRLFKIKLEKEKSKYPKEDEQRREAQELARLQKLEDLKIESQRKKEESNQRRAKEASLGASKQAKRNETLKHVQAQAREAKEREDQKASKTLANQQNRRRKST